jgi:NAD+ synthase
MSSIRDLLKIDAKRESAIVQEFMSKQTKGTPKKDGIIVGVSGGIDSAVVAALAVAAVGKDKVFGLILPERDSSPDSAKFAQMVIDDLGIEHDTMDLTDAVASFGSYSTRDEIIKSIFPQYDESYKFNISLPQNLLEVDRYNFYTLRIDNGKGDKAEKRLAKKQFLTITAAANVKIRSRMIALYFRGEQMNYMVAGTTNKTEFLLGDFCKFGDGGTDFEGVSHLYKLQMYQLGEFFGTPQEIMDRTPSPDTFSLAVSDQDFYFCLPFDILDPLLYAWEYKLDTNAVAEEMGLTTEQIDRAFRDFDSKHSSTEHIRKLPGALERSWPEYVG